MIIEMEEVILVDREVVQFMGSGIELRNCPLYIREGILAENREISALDSDR
jgi:hypothetical protein